MNWSCLLPGDQRWRELLADNAHDLYHLPEYVEADAAVSGGEGLAICLEDGPLKLFLPLVLERLPAQLDASSTLRDARSPYGYGGPLLLTDTAAIPEDERNRFLWAAVPQLLETLRSLGIATAFIRLHPLIPLPREPLMQSGTVVEHGDTISIDLTLSDEELHKQLRVNHRRDIARLAQRGFVAQVENGWESLDAFKAIYADTMERVNAWNFYHFPDTYFTGLSTNLSRNLRLATVRDGGEIVAAGLFSEVQGIVEYHLGGTRSDYLRLSPAKAMFLAVQAWAKDRGNHSFHLGGGHGPGGAENSLFKFKLGFSPRRHTFATWRLVIQPELYERLTADWTASSQQPLPDLTEFFPGYRKPLVL